MKRNHVGAWAAVALLLALLLAAGAAVAEDGVETYVLNEWNYVEGAMDVSSGIPEDAQGVLGDIRESGVLRVATEPYFPPQEFIDPDREGQDRFAGSDMELARRIAERMGVALEIVPMDFSEVLNAVATGTCDLAVSALSYTPERASQVTMSKGYFFSESGGGEGMMIREADAGEITGIEDLKGRDIVAQAGSLQEMMVAEHVQRYHEFRRLQLVQDVYDALTAGEADAAMVDADSAGVYIANNPACGLMLVPGVMFQLEDRYAGDRVAGKKGELQLMYFVNGVIEELLASGEYEAWYDAAVVRAAALGL
ncbi:MAG: amino acid ABC transporter substrate-binding protein [Clostridia bacterium]|nr:amino acid ABC transporter substrate-binding protein [Clostridia bacterium]